MHRALLDKFRCLIVQQPVGTNRSESILSLGVLARWSCSANAGLPHYEFRLVAVAGTTAQVCTSCSNLKVATILTNQLCIFNKYG